MKILRPAALTLLSFACLAAPADSTKESKEVFAAIRNNDAAALKNALTGGATANIRGDHDTTALMYACAFGSADAVRMLLDAGADVNAKNAFDATALMWSVSEPEKVRMLLKHGADVNAASKTGRTALIIAAMQNGSDRTVDQLLGQRADLKAVDKDGVSFIVAATMGMNNRQLRIGLERGLDVNSKDASGATLLMTAAANGDAESVHLLVSRGANVNAVSVDVTEKVKNGPIALGRFTALILAVPYGPSQIVEELVRAGAKVDARDVRGMTPLLLAVSSEYQNPDIVRLLLKGGADPTAKSLDGESVLDWAAKYSRPETLRLLPGSHAAAVTNASVREPDISAKAGAERGLTLLRKVSANFMNTGGCVSCHAQSMTGIAMGVARNHGIPITDAEMKEQLPFARGRWLSAGDRLLQRFDPEGAPDQTNYGLFYLAAAGHQPDQMTDAMVVNLIEEQMANGSWHNGGISRAPMEDSDISRTAMAMHALQTFSWEGRGTDISAHVASAHQWLLRAKPVYNEESALQLLGLKWAGDKGVSSFARKLATQQREDGGWSQNPNLASDAYATGQTLYALREAGMVATDPVFQSGIRFLLSTQQEDGSWHVRSRAPKFQPYFQSGFPHGHDQWISMSATAWAVMALSTASEPKLTASVQ